MIKFFRKIRQNMIKENNVSKYLLYAIGEIVLVVIGILIAIQVNNWNENVKNRISEIDYLKRIQRDLEKDLSEFESVKELSKVRINRIFFLQQAFEDFQLVSKSPNYFIESIVQAGYTYMPEISNHSFDELKSSGKIMLIRNQKLRLLIAKYYDLISSYNQFNFLREDLQIKYNEYSAGILGQAQIEGILKRGDSTEISSSELRIIYGRFLLKNKLHELLPREYQDKFIVFGLMDVYKNEAELIIIEIQNELNISKDEK